MGNILFKYIYFFMDAKQYKPFKLREQNASVLTKNLGELQGELASLRVNKVASGVASKLAKIKVVRKALARTLTTINQKRRTEMKDMYKSRKALKEYNDANKTSYRFSDKPYACRQKTTRAKRRAMSKKQMNLKTLRQQKIALNFPQRV